MANTFIALRTTTLTATATSFTFSALPSTYTDLTIYYSLRETSAGRNNAFTITFNNDSSSIYTNAIGVMLNTTATGMNSSTATAITNLYANGNDAPANIFGTGRIYIAGYTSSDRKTVIAETVATSNDSNMAWAMLGSSYNSSSAISSITITPSSGSFAIGSAVSLYGIKNS
jgi:hypothetical protein